MRVSSNGGVQPEPALDVYRQYHYELVCELGGTLDTYALEKSGETYRLIFTIPVEDAAELIKLNPIKQRICKITVEKRKRVSALPESFGGVDGEE